MHVIKILGEIFLVILFFDLILVAVLYSAGTRCGRCDLCRLPAERRHAA